MIIIRQETFLALHNKDYKPAGPGAQTVDMQIIYQYQWLLSAVMFIIKKYNSSS